jgi:DNA repair photolyase
VRAADDSRHALLSKARPLSQVVLDRLGSPGRDRYGRRQVGEVDVRSALNDIPELDGPGRAWGLNTYTGCLHDCAYCYVPDLLRVERERWGSYVLVKRNLPLVLQDEMRRKERRRILVGGATDVYQPVEREQRVTRACLEVLARHDWPVRIITRNPLVTRDVDLLRRFSDLEVGMSVPTLDDRARAIVEPGAPTIAHRLQALRALSDAGLRTFGNYAPAYPLTGGVTPAQVAEAFRDAGVRWAYAAPWFGLGGVLPVLRRRLAGAGAAAAGLDELDGRVEDPALQERLMATLGVAFARAGVELHTGEVTPDGRRPARTRAPPAAPGAPARGASRPLPMA